MHSEHPVEPAHDQEVLLPVFDAPDVVGYVVEHLEEEEEQEVVPVALEVPDYGQDLGLVSVVDDVLTLLFVQLVHDDVSLVLGSLDLLLFLLQFVEVWAA